MLSVKRRTEALAAVVRPELSTSTVAEWHKITLDLRAIVGNASLWYCRSTIHMDGALTQCYEWKSVIGIDSLAVEKLLQLVNRATIALPIRDCHGPAGAHR